MSVMAKGSHCNFSYETPTEISFFLKQLLLTNAGEILSAHKTLNPKNITISEETFHTRIYYNQSYEMPIESTFPRVASSQAT
jgi:hypothetical protein